MFIDSNNLCEYALMQKLANKDYCSFTDITLDEVLDTDGDSAYSYWVIWDSEYTN